MNAAEGDRDAKGRFPDSEIFFFFHKFFYFKKKKGKAHTYLTTNRDILSTTCAAPDIAAATALCEIIATLITAGKREGIYCSSLPSAQGRRWEEKGLGLKYPPKGGRILDWPQYPYGMAGHATLQLSPIS